MKKTTLPASIGLSQLEERINSIFHMAQVCGHSSQELTQHLLDKIINPLNERYPAGKRKHSVWMSGYAAGIIAARRSIIWRDQVEFCYKVDGVLYSTWKNTSRRKTEEFYARNAGHLLANAESAHYWINTNKVF